MLDEFHKLYPTGSLISELVQIYNGKYIVKASLQIEGNLRATGMAAADILEDAEDRARTRAIMLLGLKPQPQKNDTSLPNEAQTQVAKTPIASAETIPAFPGTLAQQETPIPPVVKPVVNKTDAYISEVSQSYSDTNEIEQSQTFDSSMSEMDLMSDMPPSENLIPGLTASNVTPFPQRNYTPVEETPPPPPPATTSKRKKKSEPIDLSAAMAQIEVEMERLNWSKEQGRDHLIKTYGKRGRSLLSDEELLDFLKHLQSLPTPLTPVDPLIGF